MFIVSEALLFFYNIKYIRLSTPEVFVKVHTIKIERNSYYFMDNFFLPFIKYKVPKSFD